MLGQCERQTYSQLQYWATMFSMEGDESDSQPLRFFHNLVHITLSDFGVASIVFPLQDISYAPLLKEMMPSKHWKGDQFGRN